MPQRWLLSPNAPVIAARARWRRLLRSPLSESPEGYKYWAFISYCHEDLASASWLRETLETYAFPTALVGEVADRGRVPPRLHPVFQDRDELGGASDLNLELTNALR